MEETNTQQRPSSRLGMRSAGAGAGEIVEVQGGHIVRSIGRKDRHSKVCTAKGPRDRRVRLAAHTAIEFYDVQDRLGYDRPSKAVDWLIKKAKSAIDELAELPAWLPTSGAAANVYLEQNTTTQKRRQEQNQGQQQIRDSVGGKAKSFMPSEDSEIRNQQQQHQMLQLGGLLPSSMDSDAIADTLKSFFPMGSSEMEFQTFPPPQLQSRTIGQNQDLRLSLQSIQDPILLLQQHHQNQNQNQNHPPPPNQNSTLFSGNTQLGFDTTAAWSDQQQQKMVAFNAAMGEASSSNGGGVGGGAFFFDTPLPPPTPTPLFGHGHFFTQRGPLQSSNTPSPSVRAWIDPSSFSTSTADHYHHHHLHQSLYPPSMSGIGFASAGGFSGFRIPARIHGEDEEHDGVSDKPSSASSDSRH